MCGPLYTLHRCGDKTLTFTTFFCEHSTQVLTTGKREICDTQWGEIEVCDNNTVCGRQDCKLHEKIVNGWRCCIYGHVNLNKGCVCQGTVQWVKRVVNGKAQLNGEKETPDGEVKEGRCWHLICPRCRSVGEKGGSIFGDDGDLEEGGETENGVFEKEGLEAGVLEKKEPENEEPEEGKLEKGDIEGTGKIGDAAA